MTYPHADEPVASVDDLLIEALARGASQSDAGTLAGMSKRTVARRVSDPSFAALVSRRRGDVIAELAGKLAGLADDAIDAVGEVLRGGKDADRLRAARLVLTGVVSLRRDGELELRLREIEESLDGCARDEDRPP
jgi:hypothetical protein